MAPACLAYPFALAALPVALCHAIVDAFDTWFACCSQLYRVAKVHTADLGQAAQHRELGSRDPQGEALCPASIPAERAGSNLTRWNQDDAWCSPSEPELIRRESRISRLAVRGKLASIPEDTPGSWSQGSNVFARGRRLREGRVPAKGSSQDVGASAKARRAQRTLSPTVDPISLLPKAIEIDAKTFEVLSVSREAGETKQGLWKLGDAFFGRLARCARTESFRFVLQDHVQLRAPGAPAASGRFTWPLTIRGRQGQVVKANALIEVMASASSGSAVAKVSFLSARIGA